MNVTRVASEQELRIKYEIHDMYILFHTDSTCVYTDTNSPWVIKRMHDGPSRWMPEVVMHGLAEKLRPDLTLHAAGAYYITARRYLYFVVYEKAERVRTEEFDERIDEALDCIEAFNRAGLYHLDTKPANFLLRDSKLVLHDWGLAFSVGHQGPGDLRDPRLPAAERDPVMDHAKTDESFEQAAVRIAIDCQLRLVLAGNHMLTHDADEVFCGTKILPKHVGNSTDRYMYTEPRWFRNVYDSVYPIGSQSTSDHFNSVIAHKNQE